MNEKKLPVSKRLLCCAELVPPGARVADIGCDHGYLSIELLRSGRAVFAHACDLREQPLKSAMKNALRFGVTEKMRFSVADGLKALDPDEVDTVVCAGMGGELIAKLIEAAPWLRNEKYTLVLQPQSCVNELRRRLSEMGFAIEMERLAEDGRFLYVILRARYGKTSVLSPGQEYCSPQLLCSGEPLLSDYLRRTEKALRIAVEGRRSSRDPEGGNLAYYEAALQEICEMEERLCQR